MDDGVDSVLIPQELSTKVGKAVAALGAMLELLQTIVRNQSEIHLGYLQRMTPLQSLINLKVSIGSTLKHARIVEYCGKGSVQASVVWRICEPSLRLAPRRGEHAGWARTLPRCHGPGERAQRVEKRDLKQ